MVMYEDDKNDDPVLRIRNITELAFGDSGLANEIARQVVAVESVLSPSDICDVLMPPKRPEDYIPRWALIEGASDTIKQLVAGKAEQVIQLAESLGMIKGEEDLHRIDPEKAIWMVEGGANRTSVVRREVAIQNMAIVFGSENLENKTIYQFGSDRKIPETRADGSLNPEYAIAKEIGGSNIDGAELTEFGLNLASALQSGYEIVEETGTERVVHLTKSGAPRLVLIQPPKKEGGLRDSFSALYDMELIHEGTQFVIATNGQYRPKDEIMATKWAEKYGAGLNLQAPVAIGDEPGFAVTQSVVEQVGGEKIITAARVPMAYLNEVVVLQRILNE